MRRWVMLGVLVAMLLAVAWWFFFITPRNAQMAEAEDEWQRQAGTESSLRGQVAHLQGVESAQVEYLAAIGQMETLIPARPLLDEFIDDLYALSGSTGVELLNLAPSMPVPMTGSSLRQITVAVTIDGDFFEVLGFLYGVKDLERLVRVDAIAISSGQDESGATTLSVSLSLRLFTLADLVPVMVTPGDTGTGIPGEGDTGGEVPPEAQTTIVPSTIPSTTVPGGEG